MTTPHLFCFGLGYSAAALGRLLLQEGWRVTGTCRAAASPAPLRESGFDVVMFDQDQAPAIPADVTHVLSSIPPDADGDPVLREYEAALCDVTQLRWLGYLSTTGVYGDHDGGWVDEETPTAPTSDRGRWRVAAEEAWLALWRQHGLPAHVYRLAGIYGPGRSQLEALREGRAKRIDKPGQVFSRIHVDDIAAVLKASMTRPKPGRIYNICDDEAAAPGDVIAYAAGLLGLAPPPLTPFDETSLSPMARSFYRDNKRVRNDRIRHELGITLRYPSYREGLRAVLADSGDVGQ